MVLERNTHAMTLVDPCGLGKEHTCNDSSGGLGKEHTCNDCSGGLGKEHTYNDSVGSMWFRKRTHLQSLWWIHVV